MLVSALIGVVCARVGVTYSESKVPCALEAC